MSLERPKRNLSIQHALTENRNRWNIVMSSVATPHATMNLTTTTPKASPSKNLTSRIGKRADTVSRPPDQRLRHLGIRNVGELRGDHHGQVLHRCYCQHNDRQECCG